MPALQKREFQKMSPQESGEDARFGRTEDGTIQFFLHAGQARAWNSRARFTAIVAGTQSGKTVFGPVWLLREWSYPAFMDTEGLVEDEAS